MLQREQTITKELKRTKQREAYHRQKVIKLNEQREAAAELLDPNQGLKEEILKLKKENQQLRAQIIESDYERDVDRDVIAAYEEGTLQLYDEELNRYTTETQLCVHKLLENHVSTTRVGPVIAACLKLAGKTANRLPSATTVNNINIQRLNLSQKQIAEEFSTKENTTIETDETSKFGNKYGVFGLRDSEGTPFVLGLRELTTKSGRDTLDALKEILFDLDTRYYTADTLVSQNILFQIRNTMSDRAATEKKFNELLELYRTEIFAGSS